MVIESSGRILYSENYFWHEACKIRTVYRQYRGEALPPGGVAVYMKGVETDRVLWSNVLFC